MAGWLAPSPGWVSSGLKKTTPLHHLVQLTVSPDPFSDGGRSTPGHRGDTGFSDCLRFLCEGVLGRQSVRSTAWAVGYSTIRLFNVWNTVKELDDVLLEAAVGQINGSNFLRMSNVPHNLRHTADRAGWAGGPRGRRGAGTAAAAGRRTSSSAPAGHPPGSSGSPAARAGPSGQSPRRGSPGQIPSPPHPTGEKTWRQERLLPPALRTSQLMSKITPKQHSPQSMFPPRENTKL